MLHAARYKLTLQFRSTEVLDNILPVRWVVVAAQVRLQLATKNLQGSTLADTVGSDKTKDLSRSGHRKTVQLEAIGAISMRNLVLKVGGQVDDCNSVERTLLRADTASNAKRLGDEGKPRVRLNLDTELAAANNGARFLALLTALAWATLCAGKYSVSMPGKGGEGIVAG